MSYEQPADTINIDMSEQQGFRRVIAWQKSFELTSLIYKNLANCKDYSYRDQIQRASVSIMNNIAEGSARRSDKAYYNYLSIAKGSAAEVESMILLGFELNYFNEATQEDLLIRVDETARLLSGLMGRLKAQGL